MIKSILKRDPIIWEKIKGIYWVKRFHNYDATIKRIDTPNCSLESLMAIVKGPDFPTGGIVEGLDGIKKAYETGRGSITIRSKAEIIDEGSHQSIFISEVPYGVNTQELKNKVLAQVSIFQEALTIVEA